jgi:hypothetical protein
LVNPIDNDAVLNVLNAQESDKGSYLCRASNKFGVNDAIIGLSVTVTDVGGSKKKFKTTTVNPVHAVTCIILIRSYFCIPNVTS